jgi:undecaprenyl-diphosphatase
MGHRSSFDRPEVGQARVVRGLVRVAGELGRGGVAWVAVALFARRRAAREAPSIPAVALAVWGSYATSLVLARVIDRDRPCHGTDDGDCPGGPSFPSDQAAGAFAAAVLAGDLAPELRVPALSVAALNSLARVQLRFHHLSDIAGGALLGTLVAKLVLGRSTGG